MRPTPTWRVMCIQTSFTHFRGGGLFRVSRDAWLVSEGWSDMGGVKRAYEREGANGYRSAARGEGGCTQVLGGVERKSGKDDFAMMGPQTTRSPRVLPVYGSFRARPMVANGGCRV